MATDTITFKCAKCGGKLFDYPKNPKANDVVTCRKCGATARYSNLQASAVKQAEGIAKKIVTDAIKKTGRK